MSGKMATGRAGNFSGEKVTESARLAEGVLACLAQKWVSFEKGHAVLKYAPKRRPIE